ncbi:MAG: RNA polymerase sigma factor [Bacteroidia bacterium]
MKQVYALDDTELVRACRDGDASAQRSLYQRYYRRLYGVCLRYTSSVADAEDVMQEGFIKVFTHLDQYAGNGSLEGWIRRIMVRTAISWHRKRSKMFFVEISDSSPGTTLPPEQLVRLGEQELVSLIQQLPAGYRTVFNLYAIEGFNHREIAAMLEISEGTSKSQYARARAQLRKMMDGGKTATGS